MAEQSPFGVFQQKEILYNRGEEEKLEELEAYKPHDLAEVAALEPLLTERHLSCCARDYCINFTLSRAFETSSLFPSHLSVQVFI
jgi:hypothetical protein